jgi:hypothetical protein
MSDYRDKSGYGIKREIQIPRAKAKEICKDCNGGILFKYFDIDLNCIVTRCQNCSILQVDPKKTLYPSFRNGNGERVI